VLQPIGGGRDFRWEGYDDAWVEIDGRRMQSVPGGTHWGGGVTISARDQARIGQLLLDGGVHEGRQVVPGAWVQRMRAPCAVAPFYGWLTWLNRDGRLYADASRSSWFMFGAGGHLCGSIRTTRRWSWRAGSTGRILRSSCAGWRRRCDAGLRAGPLRRDRLTENQEEWRCHDRIGNPDFAACVTSSFDKQSAMRLIRATLPVVEHGRTEIHVPHWEGIEQQHGFVHGGVVGMIADSAAAMRR